MKVSVKLDNPNEVSIKNVFNLKEQSIIAYNSFFNLIKNEKFNFFLKPFESTLIPFKGFDNQYKDKFLESVKGDLNKIIDLYRSDMERNFVSDERYIGKKDFMGSENDLHLEERKNQGRRKIYRYAFATLLQAFTRVILTKIKENPQQLWNNLQTLLEQGQLPRYQEVFKALPYHPNLENLKHLITPIVNGIPKMFAKDESGISAFNEINNLLISNFSWNKDSKFNYRDHYQPSVDYKSILEKGPKYYEDKNEEQISEDLGSPEKETEQSLEMVDALSCEYIMMISVILATIQQKTVE